MARKALLVAALMGAMVGIEGASPAAMQRGPAAPPARTRPRAIQVITLSGPWADGGPIPAPYSQSGDERSPALTWSDVPERTESFVLLAHDLDAGVGDGTSDVLHWMVWNIPGTATGLAEGVPPGPALPDGSSQISVSGPYYRGPGAAASGPPHHYVFELYALDVKLTVQPTGQSPAETRAAVESAMAGHVLGKGVYTGRYRRGS